MTSLANVTLGSASTCKYAGSTIRGDGAARFGVPAANGAFQSPNTSKKNIYFKIRLSLSIVN